MKRNNRLYLTREERAFLSQLLERGPSITLPRPVRGRLALYHLINETPRGWIITEEGKNALASALEGQEEASEGSASKRPEPRTRGRRLPHERKSPFL